MTFTEAAAQVLRLVGKPLHYKEITDVAIEKNLLSHVGKSPEVTMGARLAALVKKGDKDNPLVRIKPGVFALREWDQEMIQRGLADRTPALERLAANGGAVEAAEGEEQGSAHEHSSPLASRPLVGIEDDEEPRPPGEEELARAELVSHATELFESEEDDDEPIFGSTSDEDEDEAGERSQESGGRRRRRRRRGRGRSEDRGDDLPSYTVSDAPAELPPEAAQELEARAAREQREPREARESRGDRFDRGAPLNELSGRDLADAVENLLASFDKNRGPVALQTLVDAAQRRQRFFGEHAVGQGLILAAARADNLRAAARGVRPRFRIAGNRLALTDWVMDGELLRLEREITQLAERYREAARRSLLRMLQDLPHRALGELVMLLLEHAGFSELTQVRRPGAHGAELHLSGKARTPAGDVRTALVVRRDGREVGRERVTELRGALHHYGPAFAGWILTTGQVLSGAREEAAAPGAAPVTVLDGIALAKMCEEYGVGVVNTRINLPLPDLDLLEGLR